MSREHSVLISGPVYSRLLKTKTEKYIHVVIRLCFRITATLNCSREFTGGISIKNKDRKVSECNQGKRGRVETTDDFEMFESQPSIIPLYQ